MTETTGGHTEVANYRMGVDDCVIARHRGEVATLGIQVLWRYDRPVNVAQLAEFHRTLQSGGRLGRVAARAMVGQASDRWTARARFAPLDIAEAPLAATEVDDWAAAHAGEPLSIYGGPAWRMAVTDIDDGTAMVSLVLSHSIGDGTSLVCALTEAMTGAVPDWTYDSDHYPRVRILLADLLAAAHNVVRGTGALCALMIGALHPSLAEHRAFRAARLRSTAALRSCEVSAETSTVSVTVCIPSAQWHESAHSRGGTGTTLVAAVMADLAALLGRVDGEGRVWMLMPVSTRKGNADRRANAVTVVHFSVDAEAKRSVDLASLRATMKRAFVGYGPIRARHLRRWRVCLAIPRWLLVRLQGRKPVPGMFTECNVLPPLDPALLRIDGAPATSLSMGAVRGRENPGGALRGGLVEVDGQAVMRLFGWHPHRPISRAELHNAITKALAPYGIVPSFL